MLEHEEGLIRRMEESDIEDVVRLHLADMGSSFFARIGKDFLTLLYRSSLKSKLSAGFVFVRDGKIRGFIFGATDTSSLFRDVMVKNFIRFTFSTVRFILKNPSEIPTILETFLYSSKTALKDIRAEMLFISIEPEFRKKKISSALVTAILRDFKKRGVKMAKVTAETDNPGPNLLLTSYGFTLDKVFRFYGKEMNLYYLDLTTSERLKD